MKLYLVRHGETQWNKERRIQGHSDIPLNEYGKYLAKETARGLRKIPFDLAYTSPLTRAKETAEIILEGRNVKIIQEKRIQEIGFGVSEGVYLDRPNEESKRNDFHKFFTDTAHYVVPQGGESLLQLSNRVEKFMKELFIKKEFKDKIILISTHGAALTAMLNKIKGEQRISEFWKNGVPANCAVAEIEIENGSPKIICEGVIYY
jgi:broad specificity phosphatase PhoE